MTTEMVLTEFLNEFAGRGLYLRQAAARVVVAIRADPNTDVVPCDGSLFASALELYAQRPDKEWGQTDCASMLIMQRYHIREVLTHDHHFQQIGFRALLRDD